MRKNTATERVRNNCSSGKARINTATEEFRKNFSTEEVRKNITIGEVRRNIPDRKSNGVGDVRKIMISEESRKSSRSEDVCKKENLVEVMKRNIANLNNSSINEELGKLSMKQRVANCACARRTKTSEFWRI